MGAGAPAYIAPPVENIKNEAEESSAKERRNPSEKVGGWLKYLIWLKL
jgi:hypothetical protein